MVEEVSEVFKITTRDPKVAAALRDVTAHPQIFSGVKETPVADGVQFEVALRPDCQRGEEILIEMLGEDRVANAPTTCDGASVTCEVVV